MPKKERTAWDIITSTFRTQRKRKKVSTKSARGRKRAERDKKPRGYLYIGKD